MDHVRDRSARPSASQKAFGRPQTWPYCRIWPCMRIKAAPSLPVYQAICKITGIGAAAAGIPPDKISFPHALAAATDTVAAFP